MIFAARGLHLLGIRMLAVSCVHVHKAACVFFAEACCRLKQLIGMKVLISCHPSQISGNHLRGLAAAATGWQFSDHLF